LLKKIISHAEYEKTSRQNDWLELENLAEVEISSEDPAYPIEEALNLSEGKGWKASEPGPQTIRIIFFERRKISRIKLQFQENEKERTQQFILKCLADGEDNFRQLVCQQYNFSPAGSSHEVEDYHFDLKNLKVLEIQIIPDINNKNIYASLQKLQIAG
jgi:hypothetical protein